MNAGQRRADEHNGGRITLYFRLADVECGKAECCGEVVYHSTREFMMHSPISLDLDTLLSFRMFVPLRVPGNPVCETKGTGRVIGERPLPDGTRAYIVRIE